MKSTSFYLDSLFLLTFFFLLLDYKISVAEEKVVKPQSKPFCIVRFGFEKCQTVYLQHPKPHQPKPRTPPINTYKETLPFENGQILHR